MNFNQPSKSNLSTTKLSPSPIASGSSQKFKAGKHLTASADMLPAPVRARLSALSQAYGLPLDLGNIALSDSNPENIKAIRVIADMARANSKLLPEMLRLVAQLQRSDIRQSEFLVKLNAAALRHGEKIDSATAQIFSQFAQSSAKSAKLEHKVNLRNQLLEQRNSAYQEYYSQSVYGSESQLIDVEYQLKSQDAQILADSKKLRLQSASERKAKLQQYLDSAY